MPDGIPEDPSLRRQQLLLRSAELRAAIADGAQGIKAPLALMDPVHAGVRWLYHHPGWPIGLAVALAALRPQRTLRWAGRLWWAWNSLRRVQAWLS